MSSNLVVHPDFEALRPLIAEAIEGFAENEDYVTRGERNVIKKVSISGSEYNIKRFKTPNFLQAFVYRFFRKSKAERSFQYACRLLELGIKTPTPVAYAEYYGPGLRESYYLSEHLDYDFDFRVLNHNPEFPNRAEILRQTAAFTYQLHEKNVNFMDHSPGNTLIVDKGDGEYEFYLIDLNRMRFEPMNFSQRMHNFRRLWLSKTMINIMAAEYARLYGRPEAEVHALMTKFSRAFQKKVNSRKLRKRKR